MSEKGEPVRDRASKDEEGFVRRWSRRKHEARTGEPEPAPPVVRSAPPGEETPPAPVLTDADMPPIETLTPDSDFSVFMSPGVSEALRQRALQVLFRSPGVNTRCPLDSEYYDYGNLTPLGSVITHEMREQMEREAKKKLAAIGRKEPEGAEATGAAADRAAPMQGEAKPATSDQGGTRDA